MTMLIRRLIQVALGIAGALAAWPIMESLVHLQTGFSGYLMYSVVSGVVFGLVFGAFLGSADGIIASRRRRIVAGASVGGAVGAGGGALGFLVAQALLFLVGEYLLANSHSVRYIALPLARAVGWAVLGACVGSAAGVRALSWRKIGIGTLGGFVGGLLGGAAVEYGTLLYPAFPIAQLVGLVVFGVLIGLSYALVERRLSFGIFRVLNGPFKSREYILNQRRLIIGSESRCDIPLPVRSLGAGAGRVSPAPGYRDIADQHCRLVVHGRDLFIEPVNGVVRVNDEPLVDRGQETHEAHYGTRDAGTALKFDDVVACGSVKFLFKRD